MMLITCKDCSAQVSSEAATCPQCGARVKPKKKILRWVFGVPLALFVLMMVFGSIKSDPQKTNARAAYDECMKQLNDPLIDQGAKVSIIRPTCERLRNEFREKYRTEP